jgi:large repetitive protein
MKYTNAVKLLTLLLVVFAGASFASALSLVAEFDGGATYKEIMPGQSAVYNIIGVADQGLQTMQVTGRLYDITTGEKIFVMALFNQSTSSTFFFPPSFKINSADYADLPGTYIISAKAEEWLTNGYYRTATTEITLEVIGNRPPVADFIYSPSNPSTITPVTLVSQSHDDDGTIVRYEWFANNVKIGEGATFTYTFPNAGTIPVTLKVTDNEGATDSITKNIVVSQGHQDIYPIADFTWSPLNPEVNQRITFTSTSYDPDGTIVQTEWDFNNDGTFETQGNTATHTFTRQGSFPVTIRVTDNSGLSAIRTKDVYVKEAANIPPSADFTWSPQKPYVNDAVTFTSTSTDSDGSIVIEEWDFGNDGVYEKEGRTVQHSFSESGNYTVRLKVTDDDGAVDTISKVIEVISRPLPPANKAPVAQFTFSHTTCIFPNDAFTVTSTSYDTDGTIVKEEWDFGNDGVYEKQGHSVTHSFSQIGNYVVRLKVTDDDGATDTVSKTIEVCAPPIANKPPVADFIYTPSQNIIVNQSVTFTSTSYDTDGHIVKEEWDLNNDGQFTWVGHSVVKAFSAPGNHIVTLRVTDDDGATATISKVIEVKSAPVPPANIPPVAKFSYTPANPQVNQDVMFVSNSYDSDGYIVKEEWDFNNDGTFELSYTHLGYTIAKSFASPGNYTVNLRVTDDDGATATVSKVIMVSSAPLPPVNIPPVANFIYTPSKNITVNQSVTFTSTSYDTDGYIVKEEWDLNNDGQFSWVGFSVIKTFTAPGTYTITLRVTDNDGASSTISKTIVVSAAPHTNVPPIADFVYTPNNPNAQEQVRFTSTSYDPDGIIVSYKWTLNGNLLSDMQSFYYTFMQAGTYTVSLMVTDDEGASATVTKIIVVGVAPCPPIAVLRMPESVTVNKTVIMDGSLSTGGCDCQIIEYNWKIFRYGVLFSEFTTSGPIANYTFPHRQEYAVWLTVYNNCGGSDTDEKIVFAGRPDQGIVVGGEDDLFMDYFDVYGIDFGVISCKETFSITATVTNDRNENIEDLRITFAIPELGYKIKSSEFDLNSGRTRTITFYGDLDMMIEDITPGEYIALIGASDTDTIRVKYFPLYISTC